MSRASSNAEAECEFPGQLIPCFYRFVDIIFGNVTGSPDETSKRMGETFHRESRAVIGESPVRREFDRACAA